MALADCSAFAPWFLESRKRGDSCTSTDVAAAPATMIPAYSSDSARQEPPSATMLQCSAASSMTPAVYPLLHVNVAQPELAVGTLSTSSAYAGPMKPPMPRPVTARQASRPQSSPAGTKATPPMPSAVSKAAASTVRLRPMQSLIGPPRAAPGIHAPKMIDSAATTCAWERPSSEPIAASSSTPEREPNGIHSLTKKATAHPTIVPYSS